jgi:23S rRNA (cytidine1920-2'-O)/16S rRNA (cytidine1409-2'-O)-methyltransferase
VSRGFAETRSRAHALLLAGRVRVGAGNGARADRKPGDLVDPGVPIELVEQAPFVSRGGEKLAAALDAFGISAEGKRCLDVGASTGGFTHVLLERGAALVVALDVGHGQLDWRLRNDPRVVVMEGVNARHLTPAQLPGPFELVTVDVSFISLRLVLPALAPVLAPDGDLIALVKPQFEAGRAQVGRGGVVRDMGVREQAIQGVIDELAGIGLRLTARIPAPIPGPAGNLEELLHLTRRG